ncbi:MAG: hypothetical protein ACE5DN_05285 [Flavobacteriales bacterium]
MKGLKKFNYKRMLKNWPNGEPSPALVERAQYMGNAILSETDYGMFLDDWPDIDWYSELYDIEDDEELFERVKEILVDAILESGYNMKECRELENLIEDYEFDEIGN